MFSGESNVALRAVHPSEGGSIPTSPLQLIKRDWTVAAGDKKVAERMIGQYHYARGTSNTAVYIHGLFPKDWSWHEQCVGVAWWLPPTKAAGLKTYPQNCHGVLSLSRLVIKPGTPKNACSFLLAHSIRQIDRAKWPCLVTYADEAEGHTGTIYRAAGFEYLGLTKPTKIYKINGRQTARKATVSRTHAEMIALGAVVTGESQKHKFALFPKPSTTNNSI